MMHIHCHDRLFLTRCTYATLSAFLVWSVTIIVPPATRAAEPPLGSATGSKEAQMSVNGKQWSTLPGASVPIYEGAMIRTGKGTASILLKDGTQLELQPRTLVELSGTRTAPVAKIAVGQVLFRVPVTSYTAFVTPSVRYHTENNNTRNQATILKAKATTLSGADSVGTIVVNRRGGSRLGVQQGEMLATSRSDPGIHIVKAGQSVSIPQVGALEPGFDVMLAQALPEELADKVGSSATDTAENDVEGASIRGTGTGIETETIVGLTVGLAAIGVGVGLGVNSSGKASPSAP